MKKIIICFCLFAVWLSGCTKPNEGLQPNQAIITQLEHVIELPQDQQEILEIEDGITRLNTRMTVQLPQLNQENEAAQSFNKEMKQLYDESVASLVFDQEDRLTEGILYWYETYQSEEILSIVVYRWPFLWQAGAVDPRISTYNYSLSEQEFVDNQQLIQALDLDKEAVETKLSEILTKDYIKSEDVETFQEDSIFDYDGNRLDCIYYSIQAESVLYQKDNKLHVLIKGNRGINPTTFDIEV